LILFAVASDKVILGRLRIMGVRARRIAQDQAIVPEEVRRGP
jgi:hypothetical protein